MGAVSKAWDSPKPLHAAAKELSKTNKVDPAANPCGPPLPNQQKARPALFGWGTGGSDKVACLGKCEFPLSPPTMATFASHNFGAPFTDRLFSSLNLGRFQPDISINQFFRRISNGRKPNTYEGTPKAPSRADYLGRKTNKVNISSRAKTEKESEQTPGNMVKKKSESLMEFNFQSKARIFFGGGTFLNRPP
eukprot:gene4235-3059_t